MPVASRMGADQIPGTARRIIRPAPRWSNPLPTCSTPMTIAMTRNHELPAYACGVSTAKMSTAKLRAMSHGQKVNVGGKGKPLRNRRMRRASGLYQARKSWVASSATCSPSPKVAASHAHPNPVVELPIIIGAQKSPNYWISRQFRRLSTVLASKSDFFSNLRHFFPVHIQGFLNSFNHPKLRAWITKFVMRPVSQNRPNHHAFSTKCDWRSEPCIIHAEPTQGRLVTRYVSDQSLIVQTVLQFSFSWLAMQFLFRQFPCESKRP